MTEEEAIHTRLDYIEKIFNEKMGQMADSISQLAQSTNNLNDKLSDVSLLMDRSNQQSAQIKNNDSRIDKIEQKVPTYDQIVEDRKSNSLMIRRALIGSVIGVTVVGMLGLVWVAIVN